MFFGKIFRGSWTEPRYIRRTRAYLQEARMAALEHSIAAEHYQSSAEMYAERARRLEEEIRHWELVRDGGVMPSAESEQMAANKLSALAKVDVVPPVQSSSLTPTVGIVRAA